MRFLGLELSDAGIMAAASETEGLLELDGSNLQSPGLAVHLQDELIVGMAAEQRVRLNPPKSVSDFWDQLSTDPLKQAGFGGQTVAELAYLHLSQIWENIRKHGDAVAIAVPDPYTQMQLGLILGMAEEMSLPIIGFTSIAVAGSQAADKADLILHLDVQLHRWILTELSQHDGIRQQQVHSLQGIGLNHLKNEWVKTIAEAFIQKTRFDPLHDAAYEQQLYNYLSRLLSESSDQSELAFEVNAGAQSYRVDLEKDVLIAKSEPIWHELRRLIHEIAQREENAGLKVVLQLSHRVATMPGCLAELGRIPDIQVMALPTGAAALGALGLCSQFPPKTAGKGVSYITHRKPPVIDPSPSFFLETNPQPTHILFGHIAYPLSKNPLVICCNPETLQLEIRAQAETGGKCEMLATIENEKGNPVLRNHSPQGIDIDEVAVTGSVKLELGQAIRFDGLKESLQLIAALPSHET